MQPQEHSMNHPPELSDNAIDYLGIGIHPLPAVLAPADSSAAKLARSFYKVCTESSRVASQLRFRAPSVLVSGS